MNIIEFHIFLLSNEIFSSNWNQKDGMDRAVVERGNQDSGEAVKRVNWCDYVQSPDDNIHQKGPARMLTFAIHYSYVSCNFYN